MSTLFLAGRLGDAEAKAVMDDYHRQRRVYLLAVDQLRLAAETVGATFFASDALRTHAFLRGLARDEGFPIPSLEFRLCDCLCNAVQDGRIGEATDSAEIISILAATPQE